MANFWTKLQIPGVILSQFKNGQPKKILGRNAVTPSDPRFFWSWGRSDKVKSNSNPDRPPTERDEPLPERPKICNPECPSRCLQMKNCDRKIAERRLSNCAPEPEIPEKSKSFWEMIFGWKMEEPADACACRRVHWEKQIARRKDARLCDSRYEATPGDVLIFTETPKPEVPRTSEPRPRPPPSHKLPKDLLTKKIIERAQNTSCAEALRSGENCRFPTTLRPKRTCLPYEEMRPPKERRKVFTCKHGVRAEDVTAPMRRVPDNGLPPNFADPHTSGDHQKQTAEPSADWKDLDNDFADFSLSSSRRYSRIEQLKRQTRAKTGKQYSEPTESRFKKLSQSRTPCRLPSCSMSVFASPRSCA